MTAPTAFFSAIEAFERASDAGASLTFVTVSANPAVTGVEPATEASATLMVTE